MIKRSRILPALLIPIIPAMVAYVGASFSNLMWVSIVSAIIVYIFFLWRIGIWVDHQRTKGVK